MAIPDYQSIMLPLLKLAGDNKEHGARESVDFMVNFFKLTEDERKEFLPSGSQRIIDNRVGWARTYLKKAGLLESPKRGYFRITNLGIELLNKNPSEINTKALEQFPLFLEFRNTKREKEDGDEVEIENVATKTPEELLEYGYQKIIKEAHRVLVWV
ncbi:MAG: restriction endonuclease, partial [Nitrospinae bacterium]|nr:restriction endonuclease [Nitrospinota bacterium]